MENLDLIIKSERGVLTLKLNRPKKKNAMTTKMLEQIISSMENAKNDQNIKIIYFTGSGDIFSSGNDFNNFQDVTFDQMIDNFKRLIDYFIDYPKVMIAGVNGMCIGMSFTFLTLFDIVLCSDNAFFQAPFIQTLQCPEALSSFTFPIFLGKSMAGHLLINGGVMTANEAKEAGFVTKVFEKDYFENDSLDYINKVAEHPLKNLMHIKHMINRNFVKYFHEVNANECKDLRSTWDDKNFQSIIRKFVKNPKF